MSREHYLVFGNSNVVGTLISQNTKLPFCSVSPNFVLVPPKGCPGRLWDVQPWRCSELDCVSSRADTEVSFSGWLFGVPSDANYFMVFHI